MGPRARLDAMKTRKKNRTITDNRTTILQWCTLLRNCAASRKLVFRFPAGSFEFVNDTPYGCTMAVGSTHALIEISTRNISWG